jgi:hypothetical protein
VLCSEVSQSSGNGCVLLVVRSPCPLWYVIYQDFLLNHPSDYYYVYMFTVLFNMVLAVIFTIYEEKQNEINSHYNREKQASIKSE